MNRDEIIAILRRFKETNRDKYHIVHIGIFGSTARGNVTEQSDVDVVVQIEEQDLFNLIGIKQDLEEKLHKPVDIVSYRDKMNRFLKNRIDKEAIYV